MDIARMKSELIAERDRINRILNAMDAVEGLPLNTPPSGPRRVGRPAGKRKPLSAAERKRRSQAMKEAWKRRKSAGGSSDRQTAA